MTMDFGMYQAHAAKEAESLELAEADFSKRDTAPGEDHDLHVEGKVCAYCGKEISASQPARLVGDGLWAHDDCHKPRH